MTDIMAEVRGWLRSKRGWMLHDSENDREARGINKEADMVISALQEQTKDDAATRPMHYSFRWITASSLFTDMSYQRPLSATKVKKIAEGFDWNAIGSFLVSDRGNGTYAVMDGQHRLAAVKLLGTDDIELPCLVYHNLDLAQEAWVFFEVNTGRGMPNATVVFRARLTSNEANAVAIKDIVETAGYAVPSVQGDTRPNVISAVAALDKIYRRSSTGPQDLAVILRIIRNAYGNDKNAMKGTFIEGLCAFITHYRTTFSEEHLINRLSRTPALAILRSAKQMLDGGLLTRDSQNGLTAGAIARAIFQTYNSGLRTNRLKDW